MNPCFFIFGYGYTAQAIAKEISHKGYKVVGTSRTPPNSTQNLINIIDFNSNDVEKYLNLATHVLISIPPDKVYGDPVLNKYQELLKSQSSNFEWVGYLSSTGVYGDHKGNWVNEESICKPNSPTSKARFKAEQAWLKFAKDTNLPLHIFRLSGIYGPKRNIIMRIIHGKKYSIFKENQVFSRIHVDDIVSTILASIKSPNPLAIYNLADDEPAPTQDLDMFATQLLNLPPLPVIPINEANLSAMELDFYASNRRVANIKIKKELKVVLKYPTYREGLRACLSNLK